MKYGIPKQSTDGRYYLKTSTDEGKKVFVQLDNVSLENVDQTQYTVSLTAKAQEKVHHIESQNIIAAKENCLSWFGKDLTEKTLNAAYTGSSTEKMMNVSKATERGQAVTRVFDSTKQLVTEWNCQEQVKCDMILEFSGICFSKKTFSPIWKAVQIRLKPEPVKKYTDECLFEDGQEDDDESSDTDFF